MTKSGSPLCTICPSWNVDRAQGAADLGAQLHAVHRGELAQEAAGGLHRLLQRLATVTCGGGGGGGGRPLAGVPDLFPAKRRHHRQDSECREHQPRRRGRLGGRASSAARARSATSWPLREKLSIC